LALFDKSSVSGNTDTHFDVKGKYCLSTVLFEIRLHVIAIEDLQLMPFLKVAVLMEYVVLFCL